MCETVYINKYEITESEISKPRPPFSKIEEKVKNKLIKKATKI